MSDTAENMNNVSSLQFHNKDNITNLPLDDIAQMQTSLNALDSEVIHIDEEKNADDEDDDDEDDEEDETDSKPSDMKKKSEKAKWTNQEVYMFINILAIEIMIEYD